MDMTAVFKNDIAQLYGKNFYFSRRFAKGDFNVIKPHSHAHYELYYLTRGSRKYFKKNKIYTLNEGDVVLIEPNTIHYTADCGAETHERMLINFTEEYVAEEVKPKLAAMCERTLISLTDEGVKKAEAIFARIAEEYKTEDKYSRFLEKGLLAELLVTVLRTGAPHTAKRAEGNEEGAVSGLLEYLDENLSREITLDDAAAFAGFSKSYFAKIFKENTGFTFGEYIRIQRLQKARYLLEKTRDSITDVAYECGFQSSGYFSTVFGNHFGITPLDYRRNKYEK